jgi:hypothetical protein
LEALLIYTRAVMRSLPLVASVLGRKNGVFVEIADCQCRRPVRGDVDTFSVLILS